MRRYRKWAGEPEGQKEDSTRCIVKVPDGGRSVLFHQCGNPKKANGLCGKHLAMREKGYSLDIPKNKP